MQQQAALEFNTVEGGKVPKQRLSDPTKAHVIVSRLKEANVDRDRKNAIIKGMFDGNPPYNPTKLRQNGQAQRANFNTLEGKAMLSNALTPYYDLFNGAARYVDVCTAVGDEVTQTEFSTVISEELDQTLKDYAAFDANMWSMLHDFVAYGKGFLLWPTGPNNWQFRKVDQHRVLFPDATSTDPDTWEEFVVLESCEVGKLYNYIRNTEAARAVGWNVNAVMKAIKAAMPNDPASSNDYIALQQELNDHDIYANAKANKVRLAHIYVKEFDGKWSCMIVEDNRVPREGDKAEFLYKSIGKYESVYQIISPFIFEVMDDTINGVSGLGKDIVAIMQLKDRMRCSQVDSVFLRNSLLIQPQDATDVQKMGLLMIGPVTWVPPRTQVLQSTMLGDIESTLAVNRDLDSMLSRNTGVYMPRMEQPSGNPRTAEEVRLQFANATILSNSSVNRFYNQLDRLYQELYRRITSPKIDASMGKWAKMALEFQSRCLDRGVPIEALRRVKYVRALRSMGNGSQYMRQQSLAILAPFAAQFPEDGKLAFLEDVVAVSTNQTKVKRYLGSARNEIPNRHEWEALNENADFRLGAPVTWYPGQNHIIHAQVHLQSAAQAVQSLQQGADPTTVLTFINGVGPHVAVHLQQASQDPSRAAAVKLLQQQWKELASIADKLRGQLQQQAQQQAEQAEMLQRAQAIQAGQDPETELKRAELQAKLELSAMKTEEQLRQKREKHDQSLALNDARTAAQLRLQQLKEQAAPTAQ